MADATGGVSVTSISSRVYDDHWGTIGSDGHNLRVDPDGMKQFFDALGKAAIRANPVEFLEGMEAAIHVDCEADTFKLQDLLKMKIELLQSEKFQSPSRSS